MNIDNNDESVIDLTSDTEDSAQEEEYVPVSASTGEGKVENERDVRNIQCAPKKMKHIEHVTTDYKKTVPGSSLHGRYTICTFSSSFFCQMPTWAKTETRLGGTCRGSSR